MCQGLTVTEWREGSLNGEGWDSGGSAGDISMQGRQLQAARTRAEHALLSLRSSVEHTAGQTGGW